MRWLALSILTLLVGCVTPQGPSTVAARQITIEGTQMSVRQESAMDIYGMIVLPDGNASSEVVGRDKAVVVAGAKSQAMAIRAMGAFCGMKTDPKAWDTDYVHHFHAENEYQFGGLCQ